MYTKLINDGWVDDWVEVDEPIQYKLNDSIPVSKMLTEARDRILAEIDTYTCWSIEDIIVRESCPVSRHIKGGTIYPSDTEYFQFKADLRKITLKYLEYVKPYREIHTNDIWFGDYTTRVAALNKAIIDAKRDEES